MADHCWLGVSMCSGSEWGVCSTSYVKTFGSILFALSQMLACNGFLQHLDKQQLLRAGHKGGWPPRNWKWVFVQLVNPQTFAYIYLREALQNPVADYVCLKLDHFFLPTFKERPICQFDQSLFCQRLWLSSFLFLHLILLHGIKMVKTFI